MYSDMHDYFFESLFANLKRGDEPLTAIDKAVEDLQQVYFSQQDFPQENKMQLPLGSSIIRPVEQPAIRISPDPNVESVRQKMLDRSLHGLAKYGKTTFDNPLQLREWLIHLQEELMDGIAYIEAALSKLPKEGL